MGYMSADGTETYKVKEKDAFIFEPNKDIIAVLAGKVLIFGTIILSFLNPAGEYVNTFFNEKNNGIN